MTLGGPRRGSRLVESGERMTNTTPAATFLLVEGSPQAAENPPHDAGWRLAIASAMRGVRPGATEVGFDFELEPGQDHLALDAMVTLAFEGLRDAGVVGRGVVGVERIVATKRSRTVPGLGISLAWNAMPHDDDPFDGGADLVATSDILPREEAASDALAWGAVVHAAWSRPPVEKKVGVDIAREATSSLAATMRNIIEGLKPYAGRDQVTWLRISRVPRLPVALRIRAGDVPGPGIGRTVPRIPSLPEMDPDFTWSTSDLDAMDRQRAWHRTFAPESGLGG